MSIPTIDEVKSFYDERWKISSKRLYIQQHLKNRIYGIRRILGTIQIQQPQIIEIGCGLGHISNELSRFGTVKGIDLSSEAVIIARSMYPQVEFFQGDVFKYDFGDQAYDIIVTSEVIEHIPLESRTRFIQILWVCLKPNGWLILTTPDKRVSDKLINEQPIENHFFENDLRDLLIPYFDIKHFATVHNFLPILCHRYRFFQVLRIIIYYVFRLRSLFEDPLKHKINGLHFIILGLRKETKSQQ